jgi:hypothetical protein
MKTFVLVGALAMLLVEASLLAQNITLTGALPYAQPAQPVQAAPVVYQTAPVVYQPPPAYAPPVVTVPVVVPVPVAYPPPVVSPVVYHCGPSPDVIYFGGPYSHIRNYYSAYHPGRYGGCSSVVYFGRGESFERGYCFNHFR